MRFSQLVFVCTKQATQRDGRECNDVVDMISEILSAFVGSLRRKVDD